MDDEHDIVRIKLDGGRGPQQLSSKAFQVRIDDHKTVVVYNRIQGYILDALIKAVFVDDH